MKKKLLLVAGLFISAATTASLNFYQGTSATVTGDNSLISVTPNGSQQNYESLRGHISEDGHFVAFDSLGPYVNGDNNALNDVFVRNLTTNTTERVSISSSGVVADRGSIVHDISKTGRYVLFSSQASNLIDGRTLPTDCRQLYLHDRVAHTTTLLSQNSVGDVANNCGASGLDVSYDGRYVLFTSAANNLGPTVGVAQSNIYMLDRSTNTFTIINAVPDAPVDSISARMNCDGSYVVFEYRGADPVSAGQQNGHYDTYLLDRRAGDKYTNITAQANNAGLKAQISCDGRYIGFASKATNLDTSITDTSMNRYHGYVYDRISGTYTVVDQSSAGITGDFGVFNVLTDALHMGISDTGIVAFKSHATNLTSITLNDPTQLYIRNLNTGVTELLSQNASAVSGNGVSAQPFITLDGKYVTYESYASNLIASDVNAKADIFRSSTGY